MRLIIVSNRAPVSITKDETGYRYEESSGGLASGLRTYVEKALEKTPDLEIIWVGWPGASVENEAEVGKELFEKFKIHGVFLSPELMENFYEGFCNKTIWPLFHYFPTFTVYENNYWEDYITVNQKYCDAVMEVVREDDVIWVHDYHLMLLPAMLRKKNAGATIGFFLHIPFPSYEIYRLLPREWRTTILEGIYGADLIGFHTFDYCTYFLRSTLRILGMMEHMGEIIYKERTVKIDTFPMSIDYGKFHQASTSDEVASEISKLKNHTSEKKIILSIDRQDYTKGILNRMKGYEYFLENNPDWRGRVTLIMIVIPSRIGVESYQSIKSQIDELSGHINSKFGSMDWIPIVYRYNSVSFNELVALYTCSDIALITPLRDGMNLIAKEYIACRTTGKGVLILSEMAGAADELLESIIINPNNQEEIGMALTAAIQMPQEEQQRNSTLMQKRVRNYSIFEWADDFLTSLHEAKNKQERLQSRMPDANTLAVIQQNFHKAEKRYLFLDYDGTLIPFADTPSEAVPGEYLLSILQELAESENTEVILISGRNRSFLEKHFGHLPVSLVAEHGLYIRRVNTEWQLFKPIHRNWKRKIIPVLEQYTTKLPGSFIEEKEFSVVFHYRRSEPVRAITIARQLMNHLLSFTLNLDIQVEMLKGNKILEVKNAGIDKGLAAMLWLPEKINNTFVLAAGDDITDENLFRVMPSSAYTFKVGQSPSQAIYTLNDPEELIQLLRSLIPDKKLISNSQQQQSEV
ncbi:MAG: bifunctional alpha,alpha-trehalose-phosphate synthase (UDP-forming)/trehalose-phosphatase [Bacteroidota bacterium]